jgi:hypothetical protein
MQNVREYKIIVDTVADLQDELNRLIAQGWELVSAPTPYQVHGQIMATLTRISK